MNSRREPNSVRLTIFVKTKKNQTKLLSEPSGTLTMHVAAPPTKGKANREIVKWLAKKLRTSSSSVQLAAGFHSTTKIVEISGMTESEIAAPLEIRIKPAGVELNKVQVHSTNHA